MTLPTCVILVLEQQPWWKPGLQREFAVSGPESPPREIVIQGCERASELKSRLHIGSPKNLAGPVGLIVWDVATDTSAMLAQLANQAPGDWPPIVACAGPQHGDLEWTIRGAGAVSWISESASWPDLARICLRILQRQSESHR